MTNRAKFLVGCALFLLLAATLPAQSIYATLTGVVSDPSGAVVPNASVKLRNESSGSMRETVTNAEGYFTFASLAVGDFTYELTVENKGFITYKAPGILLSGAEKRNVNVSLQVGSTSETVEIVGVATSVTPVDSGEKSQTLTTKELQNYVIVSSNAAEFIKIMPGFGIQNGTQNKANYTGETIGINANGDAGSQSPLNNAYSYNGLPANSLDITADGAHVSDPGCNCDTPVNPNADMVAEFKVQTSNFSAENQKGPAVISSVAKAGGHDFHGSAFFYARNYTLNANDAFFNENGSPRPENKYYYPGGTIGGPVIIPHTGFNKNRDKLFFFTGYEYFYQTLDTGLLRATVPVPEMLQGNFSPEVLAKLGNKTASGGPPGQVKESQCTALGFSCPGGIIPASQLDPNMINLMKLYPAANADPNSNGGYNYVQAETFNQNNVQWMTRVDYSISDNTKLYVRYNYQRETQLFPVGLWWRQTDQVPYPTSVEGKNRSDSVTASLTHVFSPSMTNEFVFGYTFIGFPNVFSDPSKVDRSKVGYSYTGLYKNGVAQIPSFGGFGWTNQEAALIFNPGGFEAGGPSSGLYANKYMPSFSDVFTKVQATHTIKAGFFYEWIRNAQPANGTTNGQHQVWENSANSRTLGNEYADLVVGNLYQYIEQSFNRINDIAYTTAEGFVQDDWKLSKRMTLNLGLRMTHMGPWYDRLGYGYSIFDYSKYSSTCAPTDYCGFLWNKRDPSVPIGGFPTRALFWQPRVGVAYDLFGTGKTVLRGGWGRYYFHAGQFTNGLDVSAGVQSVTLHNNDAPLLARNIDSTNFSNAALSPAAVDSKDDKQAYTDQYNVTVSQRTPWSGLLEASYVGNRSRDIPSSGNGGSLGTNTLNINLVPVGALNANPNQDPNKLTADKFRPLQGFSDLYLATNNAWANYSSMQLTWMRSQGRYNINLNYTYGKATGIVGFYDQFNLANNHGVLPANRTHIFNAAYSIELGNPVKSNKFAQGVANGWQVTGITQIESGANLTGYSSGGNFGMSVNNINVQGTKYGVSNASILGTSDIQLNPILTCDPTANLASHQFVNGSCFAVPKNIGQNGQTILPAIYGPAFFSWDLGLFKNFQIKEQMKLQFRFNAYNFLNHPLWSFPAGTNNLTLNFNGNPGTQTNQTFGYTTDKQGHRVIQLAVKFFF